MEVCKIRATDKDFKHRDNEKRLLGKIKGLPLRTWKRKA